MRDPDRARKNFQLMRHAGMPLLAGTDAIAGAKITVGFALPDEVITSVESLGLTPLEALQTATLNPALALGATDSLGTIAPGKLADLVLLDANPLADIYNIQKIRAVVANGRYFDRAALDGLLADLAAQGLRRQVQLLARPQHTARAHHRPEVPQVLVVHGRHLSKSPKDRGAFSIFLAPWRGLH